MTFQDVVFLYFLLCNKILYISFKFYVAFILHLCIHSVNCRQESFVTILHSEMCSWFCRIVELTTIGDLIERRRHLNFVQTVQFEWFSIFSELRPG